MNQIIKYEPQPTDEISPGVYKTPLDGVYFLPFTKHPDQRGFYTELVRWPELDAVLQEEFQPKQVNLSNSKTKVIRGFHAENWQKLVTILTGTAFCAFADFRIESPQFGQVMTASMGENGLNGSLFLPAGIGNSFCVTQGDLNYLYAVDQLYRERDASGDVAISLVDPDLNINWPFDQAELIMSERDRNSVSLRERFPDKFGANFGGNLGDSHE